MPCSSAKHDRFVLSCKAFAAAKVAERARLRGVPAVPISKVGGDQLRVKTSGGEFSTPLTGLPNAWWNSIASGIA